MTVHSEDVVDSADTKTCAKKGKFCLRVLTQLDTFMHGADDVCLAQELVHDVLSRSDSDSECDGSSGDCGEEEVLDKYKVENSKKREAYRGRCSPLRRTKK